MIMEIDYKKVSIEELDRLSFLHAEKIDLVCDADSKKIIMMKKDEE